MTRLTQIRSDENRSASALAPKIPVENLDVDCREALGQTKIWKFLKPEYLGALSITPFESEGKAWDHLILHASRGRMEGTSNNTEYFVRRDAQETHVIYPSSESLFGHAALELDGRDGQQLANLIALLKKDSQFQAVSLAKGAFDESKASARGPEKPSATMTLATTATAPAP